MLISTKIPVRTMLIIIKRQYRITSTLLKTLVLQKMRQTILPLRTIPPRAAARQKTQEILKILVSTMLMNIKKQPSTISTSLLAVETGQPNKKIVKTLWRNQS